MREEGGKSHLWPWMTRELPTSLLGIMRKCVQPYLGRRVFCNKPFSGAQKGGETSENKKLGKSLTVTVFWNMDLN